MTTDHIPHPVQDFYGFSVMPFGKDFEVISAFRSPALEDAVSMLKLGIQTEDLLLLTGPIGGGKSVALRVFQTGLDLNRYTPVFLRGMGLSARDLVKSILQGLLVEPPFQPARAKALFFKTVSDLGRKPVIVIDDAQELASDALLSLKTLASFDGDSKSRVTFVLCGQPELKDILKYSRFASIQQRIRLWLDFSGLSLEQTCRYIDHCLAVAGRPSTLFSDSAKSEIHKRSQGIPRRVNRICLRSLFDGAARRIGVVDASNLLFDDD